MRVANLWKQIAEPTVAFEFFPAKTEKAAENLTTALDVLVGLRPEFVTVTFGAGGSTKDGSRELVSRLKREKGLEVVAYFAGFGLGPQEIAEVLDKYAEAGVENILVVRGDPPKDPAFRPHPQSLSYATELLEFIRPRYSFCLGAAGYPEGHVKARSKEEDLDFLRRKVDRGAEFILTNYFYDNRFFFDYIDRCRARHIDVPIIPGVMPVYGVKLVETLALACGASIPERLRLALAGLPEGDRRAVMDFGVRYALEQCRELLRAGVPGLLIYTMDRWEPAAGIVRGLRSESLL